MQIMPACKMRGPCLLGCLSCDDQSAIPDGFCSYRTKDSRRIGGTAVNPFAAKANDELRSRKAAELAGNCPALV